MVETLQGKLWKPRKRGSRRFWFAPHPHPATWIGFKIIIIITIIIIMIIIMITMFANTNEIVEVGLVGVDNGIESVLEADCLTGLPLYRPQWWVLVLSGTKCPWFRYCHFVSLMMGPIDGAHRVMGVLLWWQPVAFIWGKVCLMILSVLYFEVLPFSCNSTRGGRG